ncbi:hypothetical protein C6Y45_12660 [Alkalicoccus saliphilus]|uniref:Uncharacterized protein n=1 Tax=Alkalicoccus saliphilus TaxID=200989 RepID=A0A2T4U416_9BACI|nr:hypothetical protein C6Y45_12660 [Alkalicoccus saliphilus]
MSTELLLFIFLIFIKRAESRKTMFYSYKTHIIPFKFTFFTFIYNNDYYCINLWIFVTFMVFLGIE